MSGEDVAVAIGLTHDIAEAVRQYVKGVPGVGRILHIRPEGGPSGRSVKCGHHAYILAESVTARLRAAGPGQDGRQRTAHIFIAGPNAFAFFFGQNHVAIGRTAVYEWDFEGRHGGTYSLGLRS